MTFNSAFFRFIIVVGTWSGMQVAGADEIKIFEYHPNQIYPVNTGLGIATQIEIGSQEIIKDFGTGLSNGWDISRRENVFYLKPKDLDVETNMYIRTNLHSYLIELKVVSTGWKKLEDAKNEGVNYKVIFTYPDSAPIESIESSSADVRISNFNNYFTNYDFSASANSGWLIPIKAYDDFKFTYIYLNDMSEAPAIFARRTESGEEFLVNFSIDNNIIVVHGVYPYLLLRHGKDVIGLHRKLK